MEHVLLVHKAQHTILQTVEHAIVCPMPYIITQITRVFASLYMLFRATMHAYNAPKILHGVQV